MTYSQKENKRMLQMNQGRLLYYNAKYESYPMNHYPDSKYWVVKLIIGDYIDRYIIQRSAITNLEMSVAEALEYLFQNYECLKGLPDFSMAWLPDLNYFEICGKEKPMPVSRRYGIHR